MCTAIVLVMVKIQSLQLQRDESPLCVFTNVFKPSLSLGYAH